jgi:hypothetical protein
LSSNVRGEKPYFVAYLKLNTLVLSIVISSLLVLSDLDELRKIFVNAAETFGHLFGSRDRVLFELTKVDIEPRIIAVIRIKRRTTDTYVLSIIIRKLCERQMVGPIVLLIVAINPKVLFDGLIRAFSLSIGLRVKRS